MPAAQQQPQQLEKPAGQFAPYKPGPPGFERHTEPVRCAIWETYAAVFPLLLGLALRNALLCLAPGLDRRMGPLGRLMFDHLLVTSGFCLCVLTYPAADYLVPLAAYATAAVAASGAAFAALLMRRRRLRELGGGGCVGDTGGGGSGGGGDWLPREMGEPAFSASGRARFVTEYRGLIYLPTCACIFARDLPCFRLSFGKTRTFGTGVMDLGLGCFVFLMGLTAPTSRCRQPLPRQQRLSVMARQAGLCLLLSACGLVRLAIAPDQAVEEYGRDWNVFFSLALVKLAGSATELLALPALASWGRLRLNLPPALPALALLAAYEAALGPGGLALAIARPVEDASSAGSGAGAAAAATDLLTRRGEDFLTANREGLASCIGLYCLYLLALQLGRGLLPLLADRSPAGLARLSASCLALAAGALSLHALPYAGLALPESRRLGNLAFVAWIFSFCSAYLAACAGTSCLFHLLAVVPPRMLRNHRCCSSQQLEASQQQQQPPQPPYASPLLQLVDSRGLAYFLIGNLLTGAAVRWILPAVYGQKDFGRAMPRWACVPVLMLYMLALTLATWMLPQMPLGLPKGLQQLQQQQQPQLQQQQQQQLRQQQQQQQYQHFQLQTVSSV